MMRLNENCIMLMLGRSDVGEIIAMPSGIYPARQLRDVQLFFTDTQARAALESLADDLGARVTYPDGSQNILDTDTIAFADAEGNFPSS